MSTKVWDHLNRIAIRTGLTGAATGSASSHTASLPRGVILAVARNNYGRSSEPASPSEIERTLVVQHRRATALRAARHRIQHGLRSILVLLCAGILASGYCLAQGGSVGGSGNPPPPPPPVIPLPSAGIISTVVGDGAYGHTGDGGLATAHGASLSPYALAIDRNGNVYIADPNNRRIRKVSSAGIITTVAGNGQYGYSGDGGPATSAELYEPTGVAADAYGNLFIADAINNVIRKVTASTGIITTVVGTGGYGYSGDGGLATAATLGSPEYVAVDSSGSLLIIDSGNNVIRSVSGQTGIISTLAGNGATGYSGDGGPATSASFDYPAGIAVDAANNVYIADAEDYVIRKVDVSSGVITTFAGDGQQCYELPTAFCPTSVALDSAGNLFATDANGEVVRRVALSTGAISTYAGNGASGYSGDGGPATAAGLSPGALATDATGNLYIADGNRVREVLASNGIIRLIAGDGTGGYSGDGGSATAIGASMAEPAAVAVDSSGNIYVADTNNSAIRKITSSTGIISTVAGGGPCCYSGDNGTTLAVNASLAAPQGVAVDSAGNIYIGDTSNNVIRKVSASTGIITTVAGNHTAGHSGDGGAATAAQLDSPRGLAIDSAGNLYIADTFGRSVRKVTPAGIITTVAGTGGMGGSQVDGVPATSAGLGCPAGVALDAAGNLYIADFETQRVRKVSAATGIIVTVAGTGSTAFSGDGGAAASATLWEPHDVVVDSAGNIYIADTYHNRVREVTASTGIISTIAGNGTAGTIGDGGFATSAEIDWPYGLAIDPHGNIYFADFENNVVRAMGGAATGQTVQTINFPAPPNVAFGTPTVTLGASASSGLPITYTVTGPVSLSEATLSIAGIGTVTVTAWQTGNATYAAATPVTQSFSVNVPPPVFSPGSGSFTSAQTISLSDMAPGVSIYYTSDGTIPTTSSTLYTTPFVVDATATLQAIAAYSGFPNSSVTTATYTIATGGAGNWIWMGGSNSGGGSGQSGVYGTLGVASPSNIPGGREGALTWTDSAGKFWLMGGSYSTSSTLMPNDMWMFDPTTNEWTWTGGNSTLWGNGDCFGEASFGLNCAQWAVTGTQGVPASDNTPGGRQYAASWTDNQGNFWLFGGFTVDGVGSAYGANDWWKFNPSTNQWAWMGGYGTPYGNGTTCEYCGSYGTLGVPSPNNMPPGRWQPSSWTDNNGNLWLFGGLQGYDHSQRNDMWELQPSSNLWTWMGGASSEGQSGNYGTLRVPSGNSVPGGRQGATSWTGKDGTLWLFGGDGYDANGLNGYLNDLWAFNPSTRQWTWMAGNPSIPNVGHAGAGDPGVYGTIGTSSTANTPGGRESALSWTDNDGNLWLFGGLGFDSVGGSGWLNDLWEFDITANTWTWRGGSNTITCPLPANASTCGPLASYGTEGVASATNVPGGRWVAAGWKDTSGNLWLFGGDGFNADSFADQNDLWVFQKGSQNLQTAAPTFSVPGGAYTSSQVVSITDTTPGATVYYTIDGSTPTVSSTPYTTPVTVNGTMTIKAIADGASKGYATSSVASATYTLSSLLMPSIAWSAPSAIPSGTALGSSQLNATSPQGTNFVYSPPAGTVLPPGLNTIAFIFSPSVSGYSTVTGSTTIFVSSAGTTITGATPLSGLIGSFITISGQNFGASQGTSTVTVGGYPTTPIGWSDTSIVVPVPQYAITGPISVTVNSTNVVGPTFTVICP